MGLENVKTLVCYLHLITFVEVLHDESNFLKSSEKKMLRKLQSPWRTDTLFLC